MIKINNIDYVDLGLPSGTLWAKCNYGATNETESGGYYTWNEAIVLPMTLPTYEQFVELIENTTSKWVENYNNSEVNGRLFISKKNGNYIFIPAAGCCDVIRDFNNVGSKGFVWFRSLYSSNPYHALGSLLTRSNVYPMFNFSRFDKLSARGVVFDYSSVLCQF